MRIIDRLSAQPPCFSFEFFPPKTDEGVAGLFTTLRELSDLDPGFVSVTYGAGGSTRQRTLEIVSRIKKESGIEAMAHLTCVGHSGAELREIVSRMKEAGVENVIALRGDAPKDQKSFVAAPDGFAHASQLVEMIRADKTDLCVAAACYPEGHLESANRDDDLKRLAEKVSKGVDFLITQLFFDNAFYFDFVDRAKKAGVTCPIIPGIMPITNFEQIDRFTRMCGATIPMRLRLQLEKLKDEPDAVLELGVAHATVQCVELLQRGVPGIHFYTLNRSRASRMIVTALTSRGS